MSLPRRLEPRASIRLHIQRYSSNRVCRIKYIDVSQPIGIVLLNALAFWNMYSMFVTELTSHLDRIAD